jgi:mono/diheme cytochrome c family protein
MRIVVLILLVVVLGYHSLPHDLDTTRIQSINNHYQQDSTFQRGKKLFIMECSSCHHINTDTNYIARALRGVTTKYDKEWLYNYTRKSYGMFTEGDSLATALRKQGWGLMPNFKHLTDKNLDDIFYFIEHQN